VNLRYNEGQQIELREKMAVQLQLNVEFDAILKLVDQLTLEDKRLLRQHLDRQMSEASRNDAAWDALLQASVVSVGGVDANFSLRREDWYSDDGR
jgi:hypothetical protein